MKTFCKFVEKTVDALPNLEKLVIYGGWENQKMIHGSLPPDVEYIYLPSFTRIRMKARD